MRKSKRASFAALLSKQRKGPNKKTFRLLSKNDNGPLVCAAPGTIAVMIDRLDIPYIDELHIVIADAGQLEILDNGAWLSLIPELIGDPQLKTVTVSVIRSGHMKSVQERTSVLSSKAPETPQINWYHSETDFIQQLKKKAIKAPDLVIDFEMRRTQVAELKSSKLLRYVSEHLVPYCFTASHPLVALTMGAYLIAAGYSVSSTSELNPFTISSNTNVAWSTCFSALDCGEIPSFIGDNTTDENQNLINVMALAVQRWLEQGISPALPIGQYVTVQDVTFWHAYGGYGLDSQRQIVHYKDGQLQVLSSLSDDYDDLWITEDADHSLKKYIAAAHVYLLAAQTSEVQEVA